MRIGRSQESVATSIGMSAASISHIELGSDLMTSTLLRVAVELGLEIVIVPRKTLPQIRAVVTENRLNRKSTP